MKNVFFSLIFLLSNLWLFSQDTTTARFAYQNTELEILLLDIENTFDISFSYLDNTIEGEKITIQKSNYSLNDILKILEQNTNLVVKRIATNNYVIIHGKEREKENISKKIFTSLPINSETEQLNKVVIKSYIATGISKNNDNSYTIIPKKISILPGLTEPDVLKTIQRLPGVKSPNETVTGLHIRGGTGDQNLILWDGIQMYQNGHLFGMISGFNPNIKQKITFHNKGTNPRYGDRIASVISINTGSKIPNKTELEAGINALNTDVFLNIPLLQDKLNVQVSGRRSFTDIYKSPTYRQYSSKVFENSFTTPSSKNNTTADNEIKSQNKFYYQDYNVKVNLRPSNSSHIYYSSIFINSNLNNNISHPDTEILNSDMLKINNNGHSMGWSQKWNSNFSHKINLYYSNYYFGYQNNKYLNKKSYTFFSKRNQITDSGFRIETNYKIDAKTAITNGYQMSGKDVQHIYDARTEGLSTILNQNKNIINTHSYYSNIDYKAKKRFNLSAGFRYNFYNELQQTSFEPRVLVNININDHIKASFTGEYRSQIINQIRESVISDFGLENNIWVLSDAEELPIIKSNQYSAGVTYKKNRLTIDIDSYIKHTDGITSLAIGFLNNIDPQGYHKGESTTRGVDFYLKKDFKKLKAWGTYTFNSVQNKYENINNNVFFSSSNEIKHALNTSISYKISDLQFALGWNWHSGKPFTEAFQVYDDRSVPHWMYSEINSKQLPNYHRLDFSTMYNFTLNKEDKITGKAGIAFYNIYNRDNILNIEYHASKTPGGAIGIIERHSLRFTPNLFFRLFF